MTVTSATRLQVLVAVLCIVGAQVAMLGMLPSNDAGSSLRVAASWSHAGVEGAVEDPDGQVVARSAAGGLIAEHLHDAPNVDVPHGDVLASQVEALAPDSVEGRSRSGERNGRAPPSER